MPKSNTRFERINEELKKEISHIISYELKNPSVTGLISVTKVKVTPDLKYAKVYVSIFDTDDRKNSSIEALNRAEGYIRSKLNGKIKLRRLPIMEFIIDDSIEYGVRMSKLIDEVNSGMDNLDEENY